MFFRKRAKAELRSQRLTTPAAVDALAAVLDSEPITLERVPALSLRRLARQPLGRLVARALIQLLLITTLPQEWQVRLVLWPAFALVAVEGAQERLIGFALSAAISPSTEGPRGTLGKEPNRIGVQRIVNLSDASHPVGLGYAALEPASPTDVVIRDDVAYVAYADHVVTLAFTDPTQPRVTGRIEKIGGRIAFGENGSLLFGTAYMPWGGDDPLGGVKVAATRRSRRSLRQARFGSTSRTGAGWRRCPRRSMRVATARRGGRRARSST